MKVKFNNIKKKVNQGKDVDFDKALELIDKEELSLDELESVVGGVYNGQEILCYVYVCPEEGCGCKQFEQIDVGATTGECPQHHVPLQFLGTMGGIVEYVEQ